MPCGKMLRFAVRLQLAAHCWPLTWLRIAAARVRNHLLCRRDLPGQLELGLFLFRLPDERDNHKSLFAACHLPDVVFLQSAAENQPAQRGMHEDGGWRSEDRGVKMEE